MQILFRGGKLFDGHNPPTEGLGVLVDGGRIDRVAPEGDFDGFVGQTVDTSGGTLLPGLIDCHVHLCLG
ncbi:MAG: amidohydrolase family protein, partial [Actinomycetia bacterium]|nr:amidohydrolase family protein [Actinomycetes bacterium]